MTTPRPEPTRADWRTRVLAADLDAHTKLVALTLAHHADNELETRIDTGYLATACDLSPRATSRALGTLARYGLTTYPLSFGRNSGGHVRLTIPTGPPRRNRPHGGAGQARAR